MFDRLRTKTAEIYVTLGTIPLRLLGLTFNLSIYEENTNVGVVWKSAVEFPPLEEITQALANAKSGGEEVLHPTDDSGFKQ